MQLAPIESRQIAVLGVGYVGLTAAACFAHLGHDVVAIDIDPAKVERLRQGQIPIFEAGLTELVQEGIASKRLRFTLDTAAAIPEVDFVFVCVATPPLPDGHTDLSYLDAAIQGIRPLLRPGACVVLKSTVPVGTNERVRSLLGDDDVHVVSNPEFLREGMAVSDFLNSDRVVVGCTTNEPAESVAAMYGDTAAAVLLVDPPTAELVKYATNAFLASRLSFVNELAAICDEVGGSIDGIVRGLGLDSRIGSNHLSPGPGWGGSCFPKDVRSLQATAADAGLTTLMLDNVVESNTAQFDRIVAKVARALGNEMQGKRVGVLGLTFKAGTDDLRDSPAIEIVTRMVVAGADVYAYDPMVSVAPVEGITVTDSAIAAATNADALVVLTEWPEFSEIAPADLALVMTGDAVIDARNLLVANTVIAAGLRYDGVGRG
jgi:UDPglucose 6-dehydrogenase